MTTNHPAHGPVSLDRLHQISEILSKAVAQSDGGNLGYAMVDAVKVIDEVLTMRNGEQRPAHEYTDLQVDEAVARMEDEADMVLVPRGVLGAASGAIRHPGHESGVTLGLLRHYSFRKQPAPVVPETLPCPVHLEPGLKFGKGVRTQCLLDALRRRTDYYAELEAMTPEQRAEHDAGIEEIKAMLPKPAQPDIEMLASALTNAPLAPSDSQGKPRAPENCVTAEHRRVIEMLLNVCGAAFELADDSCQQDVDGEECHVVPGDAFQKLSDALDEIENTLPTEDVDRPDVFLAWSAMPRAALKSILQDGNSPVTPDGWIPVSDRMPERDVDVQVYCADKKEQMVGYMERNEAEGWFRFASLPNGGGVYCKPTHWMPLPAAPLQEAK